MLFTHGKQSAPLHRPRCIAYRIFFVCSYKRLDESLEKDYINSVVSLRECLLEYEWRQHGKILAERK
jgi:hypothetical protein